MKAMLFTEINKPLVYQDVELPEQGPDMAVVQLKASALNRRDWWITQGLYPGIVTPTVLGSDGCGVYEGREVILSPNINWGSDQRFPSPEYDIIGLKEYGTFAESIVIRKSAIYDKPAHLSIHQAAALPLGGLTAYRVLMTRCQAKNDQNILISGIGGGVALFAFQFAVAIGANVYVTSSSEEKIEKAIAMGAKGGADYTSRRSMRRLGKETGGFDVIIDSAGGDGFPQLIKLCKKGAQIGIYGGTRGNINGIIPATVFFKQLSIHGSTMGSDEEFQAMLDLVNKYQIVPVVDRVLPLSEGQKALDMMESSPQFGKIVLDHSL